MGERETADVDALFVDTLVEKILINWEIKTKQNEDSCRSIQHSVKHTLGFLVHH